MSSSRRSASTRIEDDAARSGVAVAGLSSAGATGALALAGGAATATGAGALAGSGTGLDAAGIAHKIRVIERALDLHREHRDPLTQLRCLGGFEIAALTGAYITAAQARLPVLVDGFITTAAALAAVRIQPGVRDWLLFSHCSHEQGHARLLQALDAQPLLDIGMRLGEASGAAVATPLLRLACALHNQMATFSQAGVSTG